jgi:hypothetical protein
MLLASGLRTCWVVNVFGVQQGDYIPKSSTLWFGVAYLDTKIIEVIFLAQFLRRSSCKTPLVRFCDLLQVYSHACSSGHAEHGENAHISQLGVVVAVVCFPDLKEVKDPFCEAESLGSFL